MRILTTLAFLALSGPAFALTGVEFEQALIKGNHGQMLQGLGQLPPSQVRPLLERQVLVGNTLAMWGMAEYWRQQGNRQQGATYAYLAWMGTMLDGATCYQAAAQKQGPERVIYAHRNLLTWARADKQARQIALYEAGRFHQTQTRSAIPQWVCKIGGNAQLRDDVETVRKARRAELLQKMHYSQLDEYFNITLSAGQVEVGTSFLQPLEK